jgi:hypothetical protein
MVLQVNSPFFKEIKCMKRLAVSGAPEERWRTIRRLISMIRSIYASAKIRGKSRVIFQETTLRVMVSMEFQ